MIILRVFIGSENFYKDEVVQRFSSSIARKILSYIPSHLIEEMQGISVGADVSFKKVLMMNLFPEMFHCIGITLQGESKLMITSFIMSGFSIIVSGKNLQKKCRSNRCQTQREKNLIFRLAMLVLLV